MGYTTDFDGMFKLDRPLTVAQMRYLQCFADVRHMKRDVEKLEGREDEARTKAGLPLGVEGAYYTKDDSQGVLDSNQPPQGVPGLNCSWAPTPDGEGIEWDGSEKFYKYVEWLKYILEHFLKPWGYVLNGEVEWSGEDNPDMGIIFVKDNVVTIKRAKVSYDDDVEGIQ